MIKRDAYISLKEAAKISGYSPDYVGQLIRSGKISGKQIYTNVSWVTTEDAILSYLKDEKKGKVRSGSQSYRVKDFALSAEALDKINECVAWTGIGLLGIFIVILISVFAISADHRISDEYIQTATGTNAQ